MKKRYLILSDGTIYEGEAFGADTDALGELVFTTGMCGYVETLTDPSYWGQIVLQTFPMIGNYGVMEDDFEGSCRVRGYVVREVCDTPSNFRCQYDLDTFLKKNGVPGICGVDTRHITKKIREQGVMNAMIASLPPEDLGGGLKDYAVANAVKSVTRAEPELYPAENARLRVTLIDYGAKRNIIRNLTQRGCDVTAVPADTPAKRILADKPDGVMLSNGPGNPAENTQCILELQNLLGNVPIFGICLGHQLLAIAAGARTEKLKYGHRGANQPVRETAGPRTYITSQNHGYAVLPETVKAGTVSFINANDGTCEGVDYPRFNAFSVQFHPEGCSGPQDTGFLFDRFISMMEGKR